MTATSCNCTIKRNDTKDIFIMDRNQFLSQIDKGNSPWNDKLPY